MKQHDKLPQAKCPARVECCPAGGTGHGNEYFFIKEKNHLVDARKIKNVFSRGDALKRSEVVWFFCFFGEDWFSKKKENKNRARFLIKARRGGGSHGDAKVKACLVA